MLGRSPQDGPNSGEDGDTSNTETGGLHEEVERTIAVGLNTNEEQEENDECELTCNLFSMAAFEEWELGAFGELAPYMNPNPRKIKRLTNIFTLVRTLMKVPPEDLRRSRKRLLVWILMCEQWPLHVSWILQTLEDVQQRGAKASKDGTVLLRGFYAKHVRELVLDLRTEERHTVPKHMRERYQHIFAMDGDVDIFDALLDKTASGPYKIQIDDIGDLAVRDSSKLISFTLNLNPALRDILKLLASIPEFN